MKLILATLTLIAATTVFATKSYQVTGPVLDMTETTITVDKKGEKFEIEKSPSTQSAADVKKGDKVTVYYKMTAENIESKGAAAGSATKEKKSKK